MAIKNIYNVEIEFYENKVFELIHAKLDAGTVIDTELNEGLIAPMDRWVINSRNMS